MYYNVPTYMYVNACTYKFLNRSSIYTAGGFFLEFIANKIRKINLNVQYLYNLFLGAQILRLMTIYFLLPVIHKSLI